VTRAEMKKKQWLTKYGRQAKNTWWQIFNFASIQISKTGVGDWSCKRGPGGQLSVARPPRPRHSEFKGAAGKRADQPGWVIPGRQTKKTQNMIYYATSKIYPKKNRSSSQWNFRKIKEKIPRRNRTGCSRIDIFWSSPTSSTSGGGRLCQGGKEKFVTSLVLSRARGLG
jgi:hypothetical protein